MQKSQTHSCHSARVTCLNKAASSSTRLQVGTMKHPLSSCHRSQEFLIPKRMSHNNVCATRIKVLFLQYYSTLNWGINWIQVIQVSCCTQKGSTQSENYLNLDKNSAQIYMESIIIAIKWAEASREGKAARKEWLCKMPQQRRQEWETPEESLSWALPTVENEAVVKTAKGKLAEDKTIAVLWQRWLLAQ